MPMSISGPPWVVAIRSPKALARVVRAYGDSITTGSVILARPDQAYGQLFCNAFQLSGTLINCGANSTGALYPFNQMLTDASGTWRPSTTVPQTTLWQACYNDMRFSNSAGMLNAVTGALRCNALLMLANWKGLKQFYNGGTGGVYFGSDPGVFTLGGAWGVSTYGTNNQWKGVGCAVNGNTITAIVYGRKVYVMYDRIKNTNTGGVFSVTINGTVRDAAVACDGTGLLLESGNDEPTANQTTTGYPQLLTYDMTTDGPHTVVVTVTSTTAAANLVQIECIAGSADINDGRTLIMGTCMGMNAAGYAASTAAYASKIIGDAAADQYRAIQRSVMAEFAAAGFDARIAEVQNYYDAGVAANVNGDNIHATPLGQTKIAQAHFYAYAGVPTWPALAAIA
jgi:hypothetical protein